jgi:putative DNA primase/helicase
MIDARLTLIQKHFLNREDRIAFKPSWGKACPAVANGHLADILKSHVFGQETDIEWQTMEGKRGLERGKHRIGSYSPNPEGLTFYVCIDCDGGGHHSNPLANPLEAAFTIIATAKRLGLPVHLEKSGGGNGWHVWLFFAAPVKAKAARDLAFLLIPQDALLASGALANARSNAGFEVFPKQEALAENGLGNLVWLPWWHGGRDGANQFHRINDDGELAPYLPESFLTITDDAMNTLLRKPIAKTRVSADVLIRMARAHGPERNNAGFWLACQLRDNGYPQEEARRHMLEYQARVPQEPHAYTEREALASLESAYKTAAREPWGKGDKPKPSVNGNAQRAKTEAEHKTSDELAEPNEVQEALDDPHRLARKYLWGDDRIKEGKSGLRFWREEWHRWNGNCYRIVPDAEIKAETTDVIKEEFDRANIWAIKEWEANDHCDLQTGKLIPKPIAKKVTKSLLTNVAQVLQALTILPGTVESPSWISEPAPFPASEILATKNSLIHLPSYVRGSDPFSIKPTIDFFSPLSLDYDFDETAGQPLAWLDFLNSIWPHDQQSIDVLQEWFGYCLLPDTRQDKILVIIGPTRSGKGTIARMLAKIVGEANACNPTLSSLGGPFGLQPLLGKTLALITDARLSGRSDSAIILENLLSISGRDTRSVHRKNLTAVECKLPIRFMLMSNELPKLHDPSGALLGRLIMLQQTQSWLNREDRELEPKLHAEELQAILLWAIEGYRRLRQRGHFVQPESAISMVERMQDLTNPVGAFIRDRCKLGPACEEYAQDLFNAWKSWCEANGQNRVGTVQTFGKDLIAAIPTLKDGKPRDSLGKQAQKYYGIRLRTHEDDLMESKG